MKIIRSKESKVQEYSKEIRRYYLFKDFRIVHTILFPEDQQDFHTHKKILEATYIIKGNIEVITETEKKPITLKKNDLIIFFPNELHMIRNSSKKSSEIITFKKIYEEDDYNELFDNDKNIC